MENFDNDFNNYQGQPNHELNSRSRYGVTDSYKRLKSADESEFASDFLADDLATSEMNDGALIASIVGLAVTILALFAYSTVFGLIGIALGIYATFNNSKILGALTIFIGIVAVVTQILYNISFMSRF